MSGVFVGTVEWDKTIGLRVNGNDGTPKYVKPIGSYVIRGIMTGSNSWVNNTVQQENLRSYDDEVQISQ